MSDVMWDGRETAVEVEHWSFTTLISSLLNGSQSLSPIALKYTWRSCKWSLETEFGQNVKLALERHHLPHEILRNSEYASLSLAESIVLYVYNIGSYGSPFSPRPAPSYLYPGADSQSYLSELSFTSRARRSQTASPQPIYYASGTPYISQTQHQSRPTNYAFTTSHEDDQQCLSNLENRYAWMDSAHMENIPLKPGNPISVQEPLAEQDETFRRGRTRQLSESSIILGGKKQKLRSPSRSVRGLFARPGSSIGIASTADAPPLPSKEVRDAKLSALTRSVIPAGGLSYDDVQGMSMSQKRLPVRANQTPISQPEDINDQIWLPSAGLDPSCEYPLS